VADSSVAFAQFQTHPAILRMDQNCFDLVS
jgi:hypothetical protein